MRTKLLLIRIYISVGDIRTCDQVCLDVDEWVTSVNKQYKELRWTSRRIRCSSSYQL